MWPWLRDDIMIAFPHSRSHPVSGRRQGSAQGQILGYESLGEKANHRMKVGSRGLVKGNGTFSLED